MSTRAIIALPAGERTYKQAWIWNDAFPDDLGKLLAKYFTETAIIDELCSYGDISGVWLRSDAEDFIKEFGEEHRKNFLSLSNGLLIHITPKAKPMTCESLAAACPTINDMISQDLNFVYVFDIETKRWTVYDYDYRNETAVRFPEAELLMYGRK